MAITVLGIFTDRQDVEKAISRLEIAGFNPKDISIVMRDMTQVKNTAGSVAGGATSGLVTGGTIGALAGLVAALAIPGLGAFFIGGPIAAALGLTGAAAVTASGAVTGAVAGGIIGALSGLGLSDDEARAYEAEINRGAILLAVPASEMDESDVRDVLKECNADKIRSVSSDGIGGKHQMSEEAWGNGYDAPSAAAYRGKRKM